VSPQLAAMFAAHKTAIFGAAAAGVVGLALLQKKKSTSAAGSTSSIPGTLPAAAVVAPGAGGAFDSTSFDLYNALQPEIESLIQTRGPSVTAAPAPIASTLLAPTGNGNLVRYGTSIDEVESDGSLYHLELPEWGALGAPTNYVQMGGPGPSTVYSKAGNLATKIAGASKS
jgi:hypothetical protein